MSKQDDGRGAPDFPEKTISGHFTQLMSVQGEAYEIRDLSFSLITVISVLSETPEVSRLAAVQAAGTLAERLHTDALKHLDSLDVLETEGGRS